MFVGWGILIIVAVLVLCLDLQLNKLSQQIKDLKEDLDMHLSDKIEESERAIINAIEDASSDTIESDGY